MAIDLNKINTGSLEKSFKIKHYAQIDASQNLPDPNSVDLSETELRIKDAIEVHYENESKKNEAYIAKLEESFSSTKQLLRADGHDVQVANLKIESDLLLQKLLAKVEEARKNRDSALNGLNVFKRVNELTRSPIIRTKMAQNLSILLIVFMFFFETTLNASFLNEKVAGGFQGAVATSTIISFINVLCSFLLGSMALPSLNHIDRRRRNRAKVVISIYIPVIIYFNFAMGVFRSVSDKAMQTFSEDAAMAAAQSAAMPFNDLGELTFTSAGLIATGLLFAIVSLIDGYKYDDEYPGYAAVGKNYEAMKEQWLKTISNTTNRLEQEIQRGIKQIEDKKDSRIIANSEWNKSVDALQRGFRNYARWVNSLINSGHSLIRIYRSHNQSLRRPPYPDYFNKEVKYSIEENPNEFFSSLTHEHISDEEKQKLMEEHEDIIMNEYKDSSKKLLSHYEIIREKFNNTISK